MRVSFGIVWLAGTLAGCGGISLAREAPPECDDLAAIEWSELGGGRLIVRGEGTAGVRMALVPSDHTRIVTAWSYPSTAAEREGDNWTLTLAEPLCACESLEVVANEWVGANRVLPLRPSSVETM